VTEAYRRGRIRFLGLELHCHCRLASGSHVVVYKLTPSNSVVELVKHRVLLIAGCIVWLHKGAVVCDNHRDVGESPLAELRVSIARSSVSRSGSSGGC
jgi:hypothetical protein